MKSFLRRIKHFIQPPAALSGYQTTASAANALPPELWPQLAPYVRRQNERFDNSPFLLGQCVVCGQASAFFVKDTALARESLLCAVCLTTSRYRSLARGVLRAFSELADVNATSLTDLRHATLNRPFRVYDTQLPFYYLTCSYPLPDLLAALPGVEVQLSRYRSQDPLGSPIEGKPNVTNQNLERLTFPDASFDLVITSDVMEHVRLDALAHAEIRRVLKPGGIYLFTVPHTRKKRDTLHRVYVHDPADPAKDEYVLEKEYHGDTNDPENAALSFRVYGTELDETLERLGFDVDFTRQDFPETGILNTELFYCRVRA